CARQEFCKALEPDSLGVELQEGRFCRRFLGRPQRRILRLSRPVLGADLSNGGAKPEETPTGKKSPTKWKSRSTWSGTWPQGFSSYTVRQSRSTLRHAKAQTRSNTQILAR